MESFEVELKKQGDEIVNLLIEKNKAYGDSALNPIRVFSKLDSVEAIKIRLDDKLARIRNKGIDDATEDTVKDVIGYLFLLRLALKKQPKP